METCRALLDFQRLCQPASTRSARRSSRLRGHYATDFDKELTAGEAPAGFGLTEVGMTFSLDLEAEAGVIISRLSTSAGFEVALTWSRTQQ